MTATQRNSIERVMRSVRSTVADVQQRLQQTANLLDDLLQDNAQLLHRLRLVAALCEAALEAVEWDRDGVCPLCRPRCGNTPRYHYADCKVMVALDAVRGVPPLAPRATEEQMRAMKRVMEEGGKR